MFFVLGEEDEEERGDRGDHKGGRRVRPLLSDSKKRIDPEEC
jgi:hypothetical protein